MRSLVLGLLAAFMISVSQHAIENIQLQPAEPSGKVARPLKSLKRREPLSSRRMVSSGSVSIAMLDRTKGGRS